MTPPKRKRARRDIKHQGRVTRRVTDLPTPSSYTQLPHASRARATPEIRSPGPATTAPAASARYTPPNRGVFRPGWHKLVGAASVVVGILVVVVNDGMYFIEATLLPGGHNELYLIVGLAIAASGTWWFGWFDRTTPRRTR